MLWIICPLWASLSASAYSDACWFHTGTVRLCIQLDAAWYTCHLVQTLQLYVTWSNWILSNDTDPVATKNVNVLHILRPWKQTVHLSPCVCGNCSLPLPLEYQKTRDCFPCFEIRDLVPFQEECPGASITLSNFGFHIHLIVTTSHFWY